MASVRKSVRKAKKALSHMQAAGKNVREATFEAAAAAGSALPAPAGAALAGLTDISADAVAGVSTEAAAATDNFFTLLNARSPIELMLRQAEMVGAWWGRMIMESLQFSQSFYGRALVPIKVRDRL